MTINRSFSMCRTRGHFSLFGIVHSFLYAVFPSLIVTNIATTWQIAFFGPAVILAIVWTLLLILSIHLDRTDILEDRIEQARQDGIKEERQRRIRFEMNVIAEEAKARRKAEILKEKKKEAMREREALVTEIYEQVREEMETEARLARYRVKEPAITINSPAPDPESESPASSELVRDPYDPRWNLARWNLDT